MNVMFNVSVFDKLRTTDLKLKPWKKSAVPKHTNNPIKFIINFARYIGMKKIPGQTMRKLRHDPWFRYCFYQFAIPGQIYSDFSQNRRLRLAELLKDPDKANGEDLCCGLQKYLNNFGAYMPGGEARRSNILNNSPETAAAYKPIIEAVDRALAEKGLTEKAINLQGAQFDHKNVSRQLEFLKLSLEIFNVLVMRDNFDPMELWK